MLLKVSGSPCSGRERRQLWRRRGCFDDIFQPWLKTALTQQLAAKPVVLASIMEDRPSAAGTSSWAVKVVKLATATVASSRAADSTLQVHLMSPPDGPTLAELRYFECCASP
uniref:Uncharacterized protein n=1 Tax=Macrostomum lignano TaxID=282301 RepID=A0A1I8F718_9PLAT